MNESRWPAALRLFSIRIVTMFLYQLAPDETSDEYGPVARASLRATVVSARLAGAGLFVVLMNSTRAVELLRC